MQTTITKKQQYKEKIKEETKRYKKAVFAVERGRHDRRRKNGLIFYVDTTNSARYSRFAV